MHACMPNINKYIFTILGLVTVSRCTCVPHFQKKPNNLVVLRARLHTNTPTHQYTNTPTHQHKKKKEQEIQTPQERGQDCDLMIVI